MHRPMSSARISSATSSARSAPAALPPAPLDVAARQRAIHAARTPRRRAARRQLHRRASRTSTHDDRDDEVTRAADSAEAGAAEELSSASWSLTKISHFSSSAILALQPLHLVHSLCDGELHREADADFSDLWCLIVIANPGSISASFCAFAAQQSRAVFAACWNLEATTTLQQMDVTSKPLLFASGKIGRKSPKSGHAET